MKDWSWRIVGGLIGAAVVVCGVWVSSVLMKGG